MNPISLTIDLDLDRYLVRHTGYDEDGEETTEPQTIEDVLLDQAATQLAARAVNAEKSGYVSLRERVTRVTDEEIRSRVVPLVEAALATPFRRTNTYGEPTGVETTLRDEVIRVTQEYLTKPADRYDHDKGNVVQRFIAAEVKKVVDAELKEALTAAKAEVSAAVKTHAATMIQQTITSLAGVR